MIRGLKTSTTVENVTYHGQIKGKINWQRTVNNPERMRTKNKMVVSINERNREYAIKENLILLEVLETIHDVLTHQINFNHFVKYDWFKEWISLSEILEEILRKNVYLSRIRLNRREVTYRMIVETIKHRNPLYRNAALLLLEYKRIHSFDFNQDEILQLLRETFVHPKDNDVLFELYWIMMIVKQNADQAALQLVDGKDNLVAAWQDDTCIYEIYHDSTGSSELNFLVSVDEIKEVYHPYTNRKIQSLQQADEAIDEIFDQKDNTTTYWSGRPDILVEVYDLKTKNLLKVIIGEVKRTKKLNYAKTGLRELIDYVNFIKNTENHYLSDRIKVQGILCTARIEGYEKQGTDVSISNINEGTNWKSL